MYKYLLFVLTIVFIYGCKKKHSTPTGKVVIDENAACTWFPVSVKSSYDYALSIHADGPKRKVNAIVSDTSMEIECYTFMHDSCGIITISYRELHKLPLFSKNYPQEKIWLSDTTSLFEYNSFESDYNTTITIKGKQYTARRSQVYFKDLRTNVDSSIHIDYIDGLGVYKIVKLRNIGAVTGNYQQLELLF